MINSMGRTLLSGPYILWEEFGPCLVRVDASRSIRQGLIGDCRNLMLSLLERGNGSPIMSVWSAFTNLYYPWCP